MTTTKLKTIEMWLAKGLAALLTGAYLTGLIPTSGTAAEIAGVVATMLGYLGFAVVRSKAAPVAGQALDATPASKQSGRVSMTLVALLALAGVASCAWFQRAGTTVEADAIDCAKQNLGQTVTAAGLTILADVMQIVQAGANGWKQALDNLAAQYGSDAVQCAANDVLQALKHAEGSGNAEAMQRAQQYTAGHRFQ